ncbi:MAG: hypothetical protein LC672_04685, partial [Acidobacteria bacterium]|nr:hypothetical protein [Acidobacteriota bacterium]
RVLGVTGRDLALLKDVGKLAVAAGLAGATTALVRLLLLGLKPFALLVLCGAVFSLVYLAAILLLRIVTPEELDIMRARVARLQRRIYWKRAAGTLS